jgi:hypothetical protein
MEMSGVAKQGVFGWDCHYCTKGTEKIVHRAYSLLSSNINKMSKNLTQLGMSFFLLINGLWTK